MPHPNSSSPPPSPLPPLAFQFRIKESQFTGNHTGLQLHLLLLFTNTSPFLIHILSYYLFLFICSSWACSLSLSLFSNFFVLILSIFLFCRWKIHRSELFSFSSVTSLSFYPNSALETKLVNWNVTAYRVTRRKWSETTFWVRCYLFTFMVAWTLLQKYAQKM